MYLCSPWSPSLVGAQSCHQEAEIRLHHGEEDNHTHRPSLPWIPHALRFDDKPDYSYLCKLFHDLFVREGYQYDYILDWIIWRGAPDDQTAGSSSKAGGVGRRKAIQEDEICIYINIPRPRCDR